MKTIFNFGDAHKDFEPIAKEILKDYKIEHIPITNNRLFYNDKLQIVDASYGPSLTWDNLNMLDINNKLQENDEVFFLGSMGSLSNRLKLGNLVIPTNTYCSYFNSKEKPIAPNKGLLMTLELYLTNQNISFKNYKHGSVFAVFDPTTNHKTYENSLYDDSIEGIDCSESYLGLKFCKENNLKGVVMLYCSDDPNSKIAEIPKEEFDKRALEIDLKMHRIAKALLLKELIE